MLKCEGNQKPPNVLIQAFIDFNEWFSEANPQSSIIKPIIFSRNAKVYLTGADYTST